jgi:cell division protein FtsL
MKKSAKPLILYSLLAFILISGFLLGYIGFKIRCDQLRKEIVVQEENIVSKRSRHQFLTARLQYYSSEERIMNIASSELGMIRLEDARIVLEVSREKINMIENRLREKYD